MKNETILTDRQTALINKSVPFFDKDTTGIIKGIALIMMFIHHFFTFPSWWGEGISYPLIEKLSPYFCASLKLCVPIFCFITGYFYFFNKHKTYKYSFRKITDILISYWTVFFIFAIIAIAVVKYQYTFWTFVAECFALKRPTMYFCWYVNFYIIFMLLLPIITRFFSKDIHIDLILGLVFIPGIFQMIGHFINKGIMAELFQNQRCWIACVLVGYVFANYGLFERLKTLQQYLMKSKKCNVVLMVMVVLCVPFGRVAVPTLTLTLKHLPVINISMDVVYAPIFIYAIVYLCNTIELRIVKRVLVIIGKYSLLMWFVSCAFYGNCKSIFQPILYFPHNPVLVTIWGLIMCLFVSVVLDKIIIKIQNHKNKLLKL